MDTMAPQLTDTQAIALMTGRPAATIRSWAHRGLLTRHGTGHRRRALYSIDEASELATRMAKLETPVTICNTEPATGRLPSDRSDHG
jgi:hypothetical protein